MSELGVNMRVLHVLASNKFSGAENVACQIIDFFDGEIEMAYCSPSGQIAEALEDRSIKYFSISKLSKREINRVIKEYKPDILHCHDLRAVAICSSIKNIRKIAHIHQNNPQMSKVSLRSIIANYFFEKYKHIFWVSDSCFDDYIFHNKIKSKSSILSNILNLDYLHKKVNDSNVSDKFDLVYCGRLIPLKNPERLLDIVDLIKGEMPDVKMAIMGDGELFEKMQLEVKNRSLENNVKMLGFVSNPINIISNSKIMLMTSVREGTPMTALEAMGVGVPVFSTKVDGMIRIVQNDINGYLYDTDEEVAKVIVKYLKNDNEMKRIKRSTLEFAKKYNDKDIYKKQIFEAYKF